METITSGTVVEMNYTLRDNQGETLDTSEGKAPLVYLQGKRNIIPGLEKEMEGKKVGDSFNVTVSPEQGYGHFNEALVQAVPKSQFGDDVENIQVGSQFQIEVEGSQSLIVTVTEIKEDEFIMDGNHPLAGETLHFSVEVVSLRSATEDELANGFVKVEEKNM